MSDDRITGRDVVIYLAVMVALSTLVAAAAWLLLGWAGMEGYPRLYAATQTPVLGVVLLWASILIFGGGGRR